MITVNIGRTFLKAYNKKYEKELSAKEFFEKEYFELFYNHNKFMQWVQNSPFDQLQKQKKHLIAINRESALKKLVDSIESGVINGSTAFGFPASADKGFATTSGLVTDIKTTTTPDDAYLSWIGSGFGIGIEGGYSFYFTDPDILISIFQGWTVYRKFLNDPSIEKLVERQVDTWNGQWLYYLYAKGKEQIPDFGSMSNAFVIDKTNGTLKAKTIKWSKLMFSISKRYVDVVLTGFVGTFGNTNKTLGFFPFRFEQAEKLISYYKYLFGENNALYDASRYEEIYGKTIMEACKLGSIGLKALEPIGLREYFKNPDKMPNLSKPKVNRGKDQFDEDFENSLRELEKKDYENKIIPFRIYKTWLLAMITKNKEEMSDYTREVAKAIYEYRAGDKKGSKKRSNIVSNQLFASKSKRAFLEALTEIISEVEDGNLNLFNELRDRVHLMNNEDFGYFIVLLKFDYAYQERIS